MLPLCGSCGTPAERDDRFCSRCGSPIPQEPTTLSCARCGSENAASDKFCRNCGSAFAPRELAAPDGDGFEDILAGWDLDAPFAPQQETIPTATATAPPPTPPVETAAPPPQAPPVETAVLDRPRQAQPRFIEDEPGPASELPMELPLRRARAAGGFPWAATFALLGGVAVIISAILPWDSGGAVLPRDLPAAILLDPAGGGPNLGLVLLGFGTAGALVALLTMALPGTSILRRLIGLLTFAIPLAFVMRALGPGALLRPVQIMESVGIGAFTAAAGGLIQVVAGRWSPRRR